MNIHLPYGRGSIEAVLPDDRVKSVITSKLEEYSPGMGEAELIEDAMKNPVGRESLPALSRGEKNVVVIASDHTRPVPSRLIIPPMLRQIREGNENAEITILIATGCHRGTTKAELLQKFGPEIAERERIVIHDCGDERNMVSIGTLPSGGALKLNRIAAEADLLVSEGFIEPHFFAGFSGGRKSVLPGVASLETVYANHCAAFIESEYARCGILDNNPIHRDMIYAARRANLRYIVNVVINAGHKVVKAFAGDCDSAHREGAAFLESLCKTPPAPADIVIVSNNGYPLDQNIYQAVKGMSTAEATCNPGGVIIMVAKCEDGCGGEAFFNTFRQNPDAAAILREILKVPADKTIADQWQSQIFARILAKHRVILVSDAEKELVRAMHMLPAKDIAGALEAADRLLARPGSITVIPEGISSIIC